MTPRVSVIGAGLAGSEATWQLAKRGIGVDLYEMRPVIQTPVHQTSDFAELVCSNSLRGNDLDQAAGILKEEMRRLDSLIIRVADEVRVPAGSALAVDRGLFAQRITEEVTKLDGVVIHREEITSIPKAPLTIIATGPLTSDALAQDIARFVGDTHLHFYDAVSPVIEAESIDMTKVFRASRYQKGTDDYLNCPMDEPEYRAFFEALTKAECSEVKDFEKEFFFEGCLPIEVIASRGPETMRFGPMKPVGLLNPSTGRRPFAVVQLRQDNLAASHFSMVGFQTHLKWPEQKRIFRMIPGLENAEFIRFGMIHRNTYINSPKSLLPTFEARVRPGLFFAGQMSGVEGYVESAASGLLAGIGASVRAQGMEPEAFPAETAVGALGRYISGSDPLHYQPTNIAFGLFPDLAVPIRDKQRRRRALSERALVALSAFAARDFKAGVRALPDPLVV